MTITEDNRPLWTPVVLRGGKMPPGDGVTPYLLYFKWGAEFFARDTTSKDQIDLILFKLAYIYPRARLVIEKTFDGNTIPHFVDPVNFCRRFELFEVLFEGKEDDDPVNRADTSAGIPNNEPAEGVNNLDEGTEGR